MDLPDTKTPHNIAQHTARLPSSKAPFFSLSPSVVCHDLTAGHVVPELTLIPRPMSWPEARHFCQRHYVDLAVPSSEEQYRALLNAMAGSAAMFWVGLRLHSGARDWRWVSGEELGYDRWFRKSPSGRCASFEATLQDERRLLSRYCDEWHMFVCQGERR